jgi:hypothetical protein
MVSAVVWLFDGATNRMPASIPAMTFTVIGIKVLIHNISGLYLRRLVHGGDLRKLAGATWLMAV